MRFISNRDYCVAEIERIFDTSQNTVRQWTNRYECEGVDSLEDKPRSGRPPKVSGGVKTAIYEDVLTPPCVHAVVQ